MKSDLGKGEFLTSASRLALRLAAASLAAGLILALATLSAGTDPAVAASTRDVQLIGLAPLYEALFAVSNCSALAVDRVAFGSVARLYHLMPADFTRYGAFPGEMADLTRDLTLRLDDDRVTFCSVNRLSFAVPYGVLVDRASVLSNPLSSDPAYLSK